MLGDVFAPLRLGRLRRAFARATGLAPAGPLADYYAQGLADLGAPLADTRMVAIDLETDGLDTQASALLEAGFVGMDASRIDLSGARRIRFRPRTALSADSVVIHGITDDVAAEALAEPEALAGLLPHLAGKVLVAHFAQIEAGFLDAACQRVFGAPFVAPFVCTMQLETRWFPRERAADGLRLGKLRARYGLPAYHAHDGLVDAIACGELLLAQLAHRGRAGLTVADLLRR